MEIVELNICLSDIPQESIYTSPKTGKKYLSITVSERREPSQWGHTHSAQVSVKDAAGNWQHPYIGDGKKKTIEVGGAKSKPAVQKAKETLAPLGEFKEEKGSDLPF